MDCPTWSPVLVDADGTRRPLALFDYYNYKRGHSNIGYQTPYYTHQQNLQISALNCPA
ncbi:MAG TPA: hypothetical protein VF598_12895 [Hymenobacter sp.]|jgi:transposase InsO family protein